MVVPRANPLEVMESLETLAFGLTVQALGKAEGEDIGVLKEDILLAQELLITANLLRGAWSRRNRKNRV